MEPVHQARLAPVTTLSSALRATATTTCQVASVCNALHVNHGKMRVKRARAPIIAGVWQRHRMSMSGGLVVGAVVPKTVVMAQKHVRYLAYAPLSLHSHHLEAQPTQLEVDQRHTLKVKYLSSTGADLKTRWRTASVKNTFLPSQNLPPLRVVILDHAHVQMVNIYTKGHAMT